MLTEHIRYAGCRSLTAAPWRAAAFSAQARQKHRLMDVTLHVAFLRRHSEYLAGPFTEVTTTLSTLEQTLGEQNGTTAADTVGLLAGMSNLQGRLRMEADMFCQRLQLFVEETTTVPAPTQEQ